MKSPWQLITAIHDEEGENTFQRVWQGYNHTRCHGTFKSVYAKIFLVQSYRSTWIVWTNLQTAAKRLGYAPAHSNQ
jgi:hypothetical protein